MQPSQWSQWVAWGFKAWVPPAPRYDLSYQAPGAKGGTTIKSLQCPTALSLTVVCKQCTEFGDGFLFPFSDEHSKVYLS